MELQDLNNQYAVVLVSGKAAIMKLKDDGFDLLSKEAFLLYLGSDEDIGKQWLKSRDRTRYDGIVFEPNQDTPGYYNLWQGFPIQPQKGPCQKFLKHIHDNVCHGNNEHFRWFIAWWASIIQRPNQKLETCICVVGEEGTGKSFVAEAFKHLLGRYATTVSKSEHIFGRFNAHMASLLLLHAEEAFWADDRKSEGRIKDLITGKTHQIEKKGYDLISLNNYMNLFVTSNESRPVPAGMDARRFAIWKISDAHKRDWQYFAEIDAELNDGGYEALMEFLVRFDLSGINLREVPKTEALLAAKIEGLDDKHNWLLDILTSARVPNDAATNLELNECPANMLFDAYINHAMKTSPRKRRSIQTELGSWLHKTIPGVRKVYKTVTTAFDNGKQMNVYVFPSLHECREAFLKTLHQDTARGFWDDDIGDWAGIRTPASAVPESPFRKKLVAVC
jgi:hypothetical protein